MSDISKASRVTRGWVRPLAKRGYWLLKGRYPYQLSNAVLVLKARNPETFNQKILYKMAHDRNPTLTRFADKVGVRGLVEERVGPTFLTELYGVFDSASQMRKESLPTNFVLKPNHGSSAVVICWDGNDPQASINKSLESVTWEQLLIHPQNVDWGILGSIADKWLEMDYSYAMGPSLPEWAYRDIEPRILVEEVLVDARGRLPQDYKFFMFDGQCKVIQVDSSRFDGHGRDIFDPDWEKLHVTYVYPNSELTPPKPELLGEMLEVAEALSRGADFVRVDLYVTTKGIKFGELTNYPEGGMGMFEPASFDTWLGKDWHPHY